MIHTNPHPSDHPLDNSLFVPTPCGVATIPYAGVSVTCPQSTSPTTTSPVINRLSNHRRRADVCG